MIVWQLIYTDCHFVHPQCVLSAIYPSTLDWGRGIQKITTYQLWGVNERKVCVMLYAYCEEGFRFKPWRSYQNFHILECISVKASILQTCYVQHHVAVCTMTENCYLLLTVWGREQDMSEDKITALWVVTVPSDIGYPPHCYLVLQ
jgi:hypothetical protein